MAVFEEHRNQVYDADGNLVSEEVVQVDVTAQVRRERIKERAEAAISRLDQIERQAASRTDAANLAQVNTQLQGAADALRDVARMVRYIIANDVVPALLDDPAFDDLDG